MRAQVPLDIAIVGMACRFPGARNLAEFWQNILAGRDAITDVPPDRWDPAVFRDPDSTENDRVPTSRGGYLDEPITFDPTAHGIMPLTVEGGEPEQFLVLDAARLALVDAGLPHGVTDGRRVEVVVGRGNYFNRGNATRLQHGRIIAQTLALLKALHPEWSEAQLDEVRADLKRSLPPFGPATIAGQVTNATAGRVANRLDLSGASFVVDAASASSLVAIDLGARALVERRADLALVGAVYLTCDVDFPMVFTQLGALSRTGRARPFDQRADGTLPGEGVGVVVLKRLADAERDQDRIYAVLKAVGLASDGRGTALSAPSARGHARAMRRAYRRAGVAPRTVGLVEGHGLGVPAADRAELTALRAVFKMPEPEPEIAAALPKRVNGTGHAHWPARRNGTSGNGAHAVGKAHVDGIALGAVSSMIGHAMPAAGMAGLIKTALALHHRVLPPTLHGEEPHSLLADAASPFVLNRACRPWIHGGFDFPRRAAVNAFGFAGISAHAVLEEHAASADALVPGCQTRWDTECILLGASDRARWVELAGALVDWLQQEPDVALKDVAVTLNTGVPALPFRVAFVVTSLVDLKEKLEAAIRRLADPSCRAIRDARGTYFWDEPLGRTGKLAFLFPGEGSQYPGMLAELCVHFPEVRALFDTSDRVAREQHHPRVPSALLFDPAQQAPDDLSAMESAINVVLSAQWALYQLLRALHIGPDVVAGHSSGEFLSLAAAGVLRVDRTLEDRLGELGTLFERLEHSGAVPSATLLAVAADRVRVEAAFEGVDPRLTIAIDNCPHQVVVAGPPEPVEQVAERLRTSGVLCEKLPFSRAYHSHEFKPAVGPVQRFFERLALARPRVPVYSCATADRMPDDPEGILRLAVDQWTMPVRFRSTIEKMHDDGVRLFVEVGARGNLTGFVEDTLRGRPAFAVAANLPKRSALSQLNHLVAALWAQGVSLRPDVLYARRRPDRVDFRMVPKAPTLPTLAVGFPEMRLSPELIAKLRAHASVDSGTRSTSGLRNGSPHSVDPKLSSGVNGHAPGRNGDAHSHVEEGHGGWSGNGCPAEPQSPSVQDADEAMLQYLRTMDAFLDAQRQVMDAYLGTTGSPVHAVGLPSSDETDSGPELMPACGAPSLLDEALPVPDAADHEPTTSAATLVDDTASIEAMLLSRISERTGYPVAMLELDLDLEGDLGIDSIKRVEIFGDLRGQGGLSAELDLDRLSRCRTLRQVLETLHAPVPANGTPEAGKRALERALDAELGTDATLAEPVSAGPWVGTVRSFVPGRELVSLRTLEMDGDPVAEHHTLGGRRVSALRPELKGLPVLPFMAMAEMLAEAAAVLVPGRPLVALRDVQAHRWTRYEEEPVSLEIHAERADDSSDEVHVMIYNRGTQNAPREGKEGPFVEGRAIFGASRPDPVPAGAFELPGAGKCRFVAEEVYRDQWLFHGPAFQSVTHIGPSSPSGIEGTFRVLPRRGLLRPGERGGLLIDAIVLDAFTHLLGCWGVDKLPEGDVIFPLRLDELTFLGSDPGEGTEVSCRIRVTEIQRHRVRADVEIVRPDGLVWMRLRGWEDWRFYWPNRYRDQFRAPDHFLLGEAISLPGVSEACAQDLCLVWLEPPADMGRPVWRDVLEWVQLGPEERAALHAQAGTDAQRTLRLWGRIAAKEAARRLDLDHGGASVYPADLCIDTDASGRPSVRSLLEPERADMPAVSIAHTEGVALALASRDPDARLGVDVERIAERGPGFEAVAFSEGERVLLDRASRAGSRAEWVARFWCAKEAVAKATGRGLLVGPSSVALRDVDVVSGALRVALGPELAAACPGWGDALATVMTARRGEFAWAWTLRERTDT